MQTTGEIVIQAALHDSGRWVTIPISIAGFRKLSAVLDTGSPVSAISPRTEAALAAFGVLQQATQPNRYLLEGLSADDQPLPDHEVAVLRRLERLDIDGLLGLDFLANFARICFDTRSLVLTLERI